MKGLSPVPRKCPVPLPAGLLGCPYSGALTSLRLLGLSPKVLCALKRGLMFIFQDLNLHTNPRSRLIWVGFQKLRDNSSCPSVNFSSPISRPHCPHSSQPSQEVGLGLPSAFLKAIYRNETVPIINPRVLSGGNSRGGVLTTRMNATIEVTHLLLDATTTTEIDTHSKTTLRLQSSCTAKMPSACSWPSW